MSPELRSVVWRLLLRDVRELVDESLELGRLPDAPVVVDTALSSYRLRTVDATDFRSLLVGDVANYIAEQRRASTARDYSSSEITRSTRG